MLAFARRCDSSALLAPTGCVIGPGRLVPERGSIHRRTSVRSRSRGGELPWLPAIDGASCGDAARRCAPTSAPTLATHATPNATGGEHSPRLEVPGIICTSRCHLYEPEAGIFNFCMPPQCTRRAAPAFRRAASSPCRFGRRFALRGRTAEAVRACRRDRDSPDTWSASASCRRRCTRRSCFNAPERVS